MNRFMSGSQFAVKAGWRVGIFLALTIGFPFIVHGLILATNARSVGGAAGAVAVVAGVYLKPLIILGFLISLLAPCWRRMRSLGLPGMVGLVVPLLFLMDWPYLLIVGAHWGVAFSLGIWQVNLPLFALTGLAILVAMSVALASPDDGGNGQRFGVFRTRLRFLDDFARCRRGPQCGYKPVVHGQDLVHASKRTVHAITVFCADPLGFPE